MSNINDDDIEFFNSLDEEEKKIARNCLYLRRQNATITADIEKMGGELDVSTARLEHFMTFLVEAGVISPGDLWRAQYSWEQTRRSQISLIRDRLKDVHEAKRPKSQLVLPPHLRGR